MKKIFIVVAVSAFAFSSCNQNTNVVKADVTIPVTQTSSVATDKPEENCTTPADDIFPSLKMKDMTGKEIDLKEFAAGSPTVISFWATWCPPCRRELKDYNSSYKKWEKKYGAKFIAVSVDEGKTVNDIKEFAANMGWTFNVMFDDRRASVNHFNMSGIPFMVILDKNGKIVKRETGYEPDGGAEIEHTLKKLN